jgi:membrane protease YdiL (CAAX protease family)
MEENMVQKRKLTAYKIGIYCVIYFALCAIRQLIVQPRLLGLFNPYLFEILDTSIKIMISTLPALLLIKYYQADMWISLKELFINKPIWFKVNKPEIKLKWYEDNIEKYPLILFLLLPLLLPLRAWISFGKIAIHPNIQPIRWFEMVLFVGITEEIVFRGWLLNAKLKKMKILPALLINSILFVIVHFPIWIYFRYSLIEFLGNGLGIFAFSILMGIIFIKSKNIIVPIIFHMVWNFILTLLFGMGKYVI